LMANGRGLLNARGVQGRGKGLLRAKGKKIKKETFPPHNPTHPFCGSCFTTNPPPPTPPNRSLTPKKPNTNKRKVGGVKKKRVDVKGRLRKLEKFPNWVQKIQKGPTNGAEEHQAGGAFSPTPPHHRGREKPHPTTSTQGK